VSSLYLPSNGKELFGVYFLLQLSLNLLNGLVTSLVYLILGIKKGSAAFPAFAF
jgi:predicted PurR-regulated permease PerM